MTTVSFYRAVRLFKKAGNIQISLELLPKPQHVPPGQALLRVCYSSVNFKDIMACQGNPAVTRRFPHTPGIDAAGVVELSGDARVSVGAEMLICCRGMGMNQPGGFAEYVQVPIEWLEPKPVGWSLRDCMVLGTAGFTAALAVHALAQHVMPDHYSSVALAPPESPLIGLSVAVTGVTGGVGAFAALMLARLGADITAFTSAATLAERSKCAFIESLGVTQLRDLETDLTMSNHNLAPARYDGVIDVAGGELLAALVKQLRPKCLAVATGMVADTQLPLNVLPFILRGVTLKGINAESTPNEARAILWERIKTAYLPTLLTPYYKQICLEQLPGCLENLIQGERTAGRIVIECRNEDRPI